MDESLVAGIAAAMAGADPDRALSEARALAARATTADDATRAIITDRLRTAEARAAERDAHRRTHERLAMLSSASFEGIMVHADGVIIDANQRLADLLGYARAEDVVGAHTMQLCVAPEDLPDVIRRVRAGLEETYTITGVRKDGSRFRAELQSKQGHLGERPVRIAAVRDVTEREVTAERLREDERQFRALVEQTFDLVVFSRAGVIVDVGGRLTETLGYTRDEMAGRSVLDFTSPEALTLARHVVENRVSGAFESVLVDARGEPVPVEVVATTSTLGGEPVRVSGLRDLRPVKQLERERRRLEQRLERSQRMESLGVLAGGIAHDFNNLLVGVLANASLIAERTTEQAIRDAARAIVEAAQQTAHLTAQMLAYAGRDDGGRREPVDLTALFGELRALIGAALSKKARLDLDLGPGAVVIGTRATLTLVVMNLLTNASDALGARPGRIAVTTRRVTRLEPRLAEALAGRTPAAEWVLLSVTDDGCGMNDATRERVFEPFFSTKTKGHGLGLAACFGIVTSHGGAIVVESEPGQGSCFTVALPAGDLAPVKPRRAPSPSLRPRTVLIIDDEPRVRSVARRALELQGYTVVDAPGGLAGLDAFAETAPDVVLVDLSMPDLDGIEVTRRIRAAGSRVPVVLTSGYLDVLADRPQDRALIDHFLAKPFTVAQLSEALEAALAAAARRT